MAGWAAVGKRSGALTAAVAARRGPCVPERGQTRPLTPNSPRLPHPHTQDEREKKWRIQAVSAAPGSFESRKALPVPWRGLRDDALSQAADVPGCVFVHASGFIGGAATQEAVLALARKSLAM